MKRKLLGLLLALTMLVGLMPTFAFGVSAEDTYTWDIDINGVLTVTGTGETYDGWEGNQPWRSQREAITKIVVGEGITTIGGSSFRDIPYVTEVILPSTVKVIEGNAFSHSPYLQSINLPEGLEEIGYSAFVSCKSLTSVTIPSTVKTLDGYNYQGCTSLKKVEFKCSLSSLPQYMFEGCTSLEEIVWPTGLSRIDGLCCFQNCTSLKKVTLPETVMTLGGYVFNGCTSLTEINTDNILAFGQRTFGNCPSLSTIKINDAVKSITSYMFENSGITSLSLPDGLETIEGGAFSGCTKLEYINLPENLKWEWSGRYANLFSGCTSLKEITIPKSIKSVDGAMFKDCTSLEKVTLHDDITEIQYYAFENCISLKSITLPKNLVDIQYDAFAGSGITEITIPNKVGTRSYHYESFNNSNIETVYFEEGRTEIPDKLFQGAKKLKNIDLSNIERIGSYAFSGCTEVEPVLTSKIKEYGSYAFANCQKLTDFEIPSWMEAIPDGLLSGTGIGYLQFPNTVKKIGNDAYKNCKNLSYIGFSSSVTDIGNYAFSGCTALDAVDIPGTVLNIGQSAFADCTNLSSLTMHKGTQTLGGGCFDNCNLREIRPSQTIRVLDDTMFNHNPVNILVVPRFCSEWNGSAWSYNDFRPNKAFVPSNVKNFDIWMWGNTGGTAYGREGTAAQLEAESEADEDPGITFTAIEVPLDVLEYDKDTVEVALDETYDSATIVTWEPEPTYLKPGDYGAATLMGEILGDIIGVTSPLPIDTEIISFSSSDTSVATVDETGYIHGEGYGTAVITISCESGISDTLTVNVVRPSIGIAISSGEEALRVGESVTLTADTIPAGYEENYSWSSSDTSVATVSGGTVTAVGEGNAVITVSGEYSGKSASCVVSVISKNAPPERLSVNSFIFGCGVTLTDAEIGGNVIAALYDGNNTLLGTDIHPAKENIDVSFRVATDTDLAGAKIKVFWWDDALVKPMSMLKLIEIE